MCQGESTIQRRGQPSKFYRSAPSGLGMGWAPERCSRQDIAALTLAPDLHDLHPCTALSPV